MLTFNQMVNGPKSTANTFEEMTKAKDSGWQPIPGGKRGGQRKKVGGKWSYRYPDQKPTKKEGAFSKLFGGMKKLFGKKPTPASREKLETMASDKGMLSGISKLTDLPSLFGLRDMLLAHGAEAKKPRAAAEPKEPKEPSERENNFDTMPDYEPRERKTNPLNKLLALVNKRIGQLESEEPEKKDEPKLESQEMRTKANRLISELRGDKKYVRMSLLERVRTMASEIRARLDPENSSYELVDEERRELRGVVQNLRIEETRLARELSRRGYDVQDIEPKSKANFDTMPESDAQGTQGTKDADAAHPEDRHEEVPDRKTRGLGEHNDKLSNIILDGKPLSDDTEFLDHLEVDDYPYGRDTTTAKFTVERERRPRRADPSKSRHLFKEFRYRAVMQTVNPKTGVLNKPKKATYSGSVKFFMHEGKTYVLEHSAEYGMVRIQKVAGGFKNAMFETPDEPRPTNSIAVNTGGGESDEHPAGYMSLYEAATGKPAPKVQDFKDARKRMEDRREAQRQKIAKEVAEQGKANLREAVGLGAGATDAETQERVDAIREGKASMVDGKYVEKPKTAATQALEFVESNKPENRTKTAKDTVMKFLTEKRRTQSAMVSLLGAYDDGGGYSLQLKQAKTGTLTAIVTRPDGSQSKKKLPKAISATAPQDIHKIALEHLSGVTEADNKKAATQAKDLDAAVAKFEAANNSQSFGGFNPDAVFTDRQTFEKHKAPSGHGKAAVSNKVQKYLEKFASRDSFRGGLRYVYHGDGASVATDGHRMVIVPTDKKLRGRDRGLMVPSAQVRKEESSQGSFGDSQDHKEYNQNRAESKSFPNYRQVEPQGNIPHYADVKKLTAALDLAIAHKKAGGVMTSVRLVVSDSGELSVRIDPSLGDKEGITGRREDMPTEISLGRKLTGESKATDHFINAKYLKDALTGAGDGIVRIGINAKGLNPITIEHTNGIRHTVMPMRA